MTPQIALTLGIIVMALVVFATEKLRVDVVALLVLLTVGLTGLVDPKDVFSGFSNSAVITVWAVYIVSAGLFKTGVADIMGRFILRLAGQNQMRLTVVIMLTCGLMSAFMNNVGATAMLLPGVISISRQTKIPVSKLLIPLSFSSLLGGGLTLIGTPANILAADIVAEHGLPTFGFFDFTPLGLFVFATGVVYMALVGRHLLPARPSPDDIHSLRQLIPYMGEARVLPDSKLVDQTLFESRLGADYDLTVISIMRGERGKTALHRNTVILADDIMLIEGPVEKLMQASQELGLDIGTEKLLELNGTANEKMEIFEATLATRSSLIGHTLNSMRFRDRFGFTVLAIRRQGEMLTKRLRDVQLRFGDGLLLQGPRERLAALREGNEFLLLDAIKIPKSVRHKLWVSVAILVAVVCLVLFAGLEISLAMVMGAVAMVLTGCLTIEEAHASIDWRTVFLVAGMLPLGIAMETTGTARYIADLMLTTIGQWGPMAALAGMYILAALVTQPMSNAAAMVLVIPIALDTALSLGANHLAFALAVVIGGVTSFLTPVGHKANVLVFGPGGYKFFDYAKVGSLLTVAIFIVTMLVLPIFFPLFP